MPWAGDESGWPAVVDQEKEADEKNAAISRNDLAGIALPEQDGVAFSAGCAQSITIGMTLA
jgi:hypothetical protein